MADIGQQLVRTIPWREITLGEKLGEGGFGIVYRGTWKHMREEVAVKKIKGEIGADAEAELKREAEITKRLDSPYIIRLWGLCWERQNYAMVMELMPKASLYHLLHNGQELPWNIRYSIAQDIAYGLRLLHENRILHRDLKSLNVLLDDRLRARLADFGLAKVKTQSRTTSKDSGGSVGTLAWMAPELFEGESCTEKTDLYAYGMTAWELASRETPFSQVANQHVIPVLVGKGKRPELPAECPQAFKTLIQKCWAQEPSERPTLDFVVDTLQRVAGAQSAPASAATQYKDSSLESLGMVTASPARPQASPDAELKQQLEQLRLDKQKAEQDRKALEQRLAQEQQRASQEKQALEQRLAQQQERIAREKSEQERKQAEERQAQQRAEAARAAATKPAAPLRPAPQPVAAAPARPAVDPRELTTFLTNIAWGRQDEAEAMLRQTPALALTPSDVTDHANRTFRGITGFQYALWALDWHMWRMLQRYIPEAEQRMQASQLATGLWVREHGEHAEHLLKKLIQAYTTYIDNYDPWPVDKLNKWWLEEIGGAQKLLPIHVLQEYCNPDRPFDPCPSFKEDKFSRKLDFDIAKVSKEFSTYRGRAGGGALVVAPGDALWPVVEDRTAVSTMLEARMSQRRELVANLLGAAARAVAKPR